MWNRQLRFASALRPWLTETGGGSAYEGSSFTGVDICILFVPATSRVRVLSLSPLSTLCGVLDSLMDVKLHDQTIRLHVRTVKKKLPPRKHRGQHWVTASVRLSPIAASSPREAMDPMRPLLQCKPSLTASKTRYFTALPMSRREKPEAR